MTHSILILGGGDIGSAVAHRLFLLGTAPILHDINAPAHPRRGMAFTDAWFAGTATLEGVAAFRSGSVEAIRDLREDIHALPVTSVAVAPLVEAFSFAAVVDARMRKREVPADIRSLAALTIGLGPGFSPNRNCHIAIETAWGDALGTVLYNQESRALAGEPRPIGAVGRERFVYSPCAGLWRTDCHIGQKVTANEVVGSVDATPVCAPLAGTIRGLPHDSVEVKQRQKIVEIDPRNPAEVFGLGERPRAIARGVSAALDLGTGLEDALYQFEWEYRAKLDCIPMCGRRTLDLCGVKLSLMQWRALPHAVRETLLEVPVSETSIARVRSHILRWTEKLELGKVEQFDPPGADLRSADHLESVPAALILHGRSNVTLAQWHALDALKRYTLVKLCSKGHRNLGAALREFGI